MSAALRRHPPRCRLPHAKKWSELNESLSAENTFDARLHYLDRFNIGDRESTLKKFESEHPLGFCIMDVSTFPCVRRAA